MGGKSCEHEWFRGSSRAFTCLIIIIKRYNNSSKVILTVLFFFAVASSQASSWSNDMSTIAWRWAVLCVDNDRRMIWMELMCIKRRHENGCLWPSEGYSPATVVVIAEFYTRWVTRIIPLPPPPNCSFIWKLNEFSSCVSSIQSHADTTTLDLQGPIFVHEPAYKVEFSNNTGGHVHCSGHANPYPEVIQTFYLALLRPTPTARCDKILQWVSRFAPDALESRNQIRQEKKV